MNEFIKEASRYGVDNHTASVYFYFVDELEKCGHITELEKQAMLGKLTSMAMAKFPKTTAAISGALGNMQRAAVENPFFVHAMSTGDVAGMGMAGLAGGLKGLSKMKAAKATDVAGEAMDTVSNVLEVFT